MKKQSLILGAAIAATLSSGMAFADVSANAGVVSQYYYRGVQQTTGASANGGVDYEDASGFYAGTWLADVGGHNVTAPATGADGTEIDLYFGYGGEMEDIGYSIGYTLYLYTGAFDTEYGEVNLGASYGDFGLDVAVGTHEGGAVDDDYSFISVSYGTGPFSASYGTWGSDWGGSVLEVGLSTDIGGADAGVSIINGDPDDNFTGIGTNATNGTAVVFSLSKSFDL